jgi:phage terminase large subunit
MAVATQLEREVEIPYCPRLWASRLHASFKRWAALVLHRRAGKTTAILNHHQRAALDNEWEKTRLNYLLPSLSLKEIHQLLKRRTYWHVMPTFHQAKLTGAWDTLKEISRPIPGIKANQSELSITYPNGSKLQLIGAADPDALRGPALSGLSLDEYSQIPVNAFGEVLSKALADHLGYCIWSGTIKGHDHLFNTYQAAKDDSEWFSLWQDVDASLATESGATLTAIRQAMEDDRKLVKLGLMTQAEFDQEWYLSAEAAIKGAFYGAEIQQARKDGRIGRVPYDPMLPVDTDWDLGIDAMAVWFSQSDRGGTVRLIDYYEDIGGGLEAAIKAVREKPYIYGQHWGPHDIEVREISSGKTRRQIAAALGLKFEITPRLDVDEGITATQMFFNRCYFDETKCKGGLLALTHYRRTYNQRLNVFTATPVHDGASHGADAFRGRAVRYKLPQMEIAKKQEPRRPVAASYMGA